MADNLVANAGSGGGTMRFFLDTNSVDWAGSVCAYVSGGSAGAWTIQQVDATHGLPVSVLGTVPLPTGAATAANQATEISGLAAIIVLASTGRWLCPGAFWQATQPVSLASLPALTAGSAVIGHVIADSGTITTVSAVTAITNALPAGSNIIGKVGIDQTTPGTTNLVALAANQTVNLAQVGGTNVLTGGVAGSQGVGGLAAAGAAVAGNPVLVGGSDGTDARAFATDASGHPQVVPASLVVSGTGAALNATPVAATNVSGYGWVSVITEGTFSSQPYTFLGNDGTNWVSIPLTSGQLGISPTTNASGSGTIYSGPVPTKFFQVILTAYSSGTVSQVAYFSSSVGLTSTITVLVGGMGSVATVNSPSVDAQSTNICLNELSFPLLYNSSSLGSLPRNNTDLSLLASAARTATTASADQTNYNGSGKVRVVLNVTVASGSGGLQVVVQGKDSISGNYYALNASPSAVLTTGTYVYDIVPGGETAANGITQATQTFVPRTWRVNVVAGDGSSYTYSISAVTMVN